MGSLVLFHHILPEHKNITLRNLNSGDEQTLKLIFEQHYQPLVNFAKSYLFDLAEAEDVVQQTFIKFWEKADTMVIERTIQDYLFTAVKNQCLNRLASIKVSDKHKILYLEAHMMAIKSGNTINEELESKIVAAINQLPLQVRKIIELKYTEDKKISEIAEILNVSKNTVKTQLQRGKAKLKASISFGTVAFAFLISQLF